MPAVTRKGDETVGTCNLGLPCCPHGRTGSNIDTSPNVFINGRGVHRLNDTGNTNCPHSGTFKSITGSSSVFINGLPATRVGDITTCQSCGLFGNHSSGSEDVFIGG